MVMCVICVVLNFQPLQDRYVITTYIVYSLYKTPHHMKTFFIVKINLVGFSSYIFLQFFLLNFNFFSMLKNQVENILNTNINQSFTSVYEVEPVTEKMPFCYSVLNLIVINKGDLVQSCMKILNHGLFWLQGIRIQH